MSESLVSILVPAYNADRWIAQALDSALAQTWPRKEVIVVDDGSADATLESARAFEGRGVKVVSQANRGAAAARNAALRLSQGDWIQFLDADDLLRPDKIARQMALAAAVGPEYALCGHWSRFTESPEHAAMDDQLLTMDADPVDWMVAKLSTHRMMHPGAWLVSRDLAMRAGPWDERLSLDDDGEYFARVVLASKGVRACPDAASLYRSSLPASLSGSRSAAAHASALLSVSLATDRLLAAETSNRTREACAKAFMQVSFSAYPEARDVAAQAEARARSCGGASILPPGGPAFTALARMLGWKAARRIQDGYRRLVAFVLAPG